MPALPAATDFTGATVTEGQFKTAITGLRAYLNDLFGTDGTKATARNTLGVPTPEQMQAYVAEVDADRIDAQNAAAAAQAAWSAAVAANPDLNPWGRMNPSTIQEDFTLAAGFNAVSAGPLTIGEGVDITLGDNSNWTIA
jgi:hypothetical protein